MKLAKRCISLHHHNSNVQVDNDRMVDGSHGQIKGLLVLGLSSNSLFGPIPASVGNLSNLRALCLEGNMMNGKVPRSIGQLTSLETLYLLDNNWESTMTNIHFHNLSNIYIFSISSKINSFSFKVTQDCFTYFKHLYLVEVCGCRDVILENVGIFGEIPHWFYKISSQILEQALSHNKISGSIPLWFGVSTLDLRNNLLSTTMPANIGKEMSNLIFLYLSNNHLNGSIPLSLTRIRHL
ncbi:Receptor-like protein 12 [Glycine soja]